MNSRRVAIVAGCRTPFVRSGTVFRDLTALDLAKACVRELIERTEIDPGQIGSVVMGQVVPSVKAPNLGREVALGVGLPKSVSAHTVNRACASANQAIVDVATDILLGHSDVGVAGGAESLSDVPILHSRRMARTLVEMQKAKTLGARLAALAKLRPRDLVPQTPAIAEPSTGLTMGQSAEKMAQENGITREEQDAIALASHRNGWAATEDGRLPAQTCPVPVPPKYETTVTGDNLLRKDTSLEALASLNPAFDRRYGTVTAGNSSPLTDGAAAVLLMSEEKARAEGYEPRLSSRSGRWPRWTPADSSSWGQHWPFPGPSSGRGWSWTTWSSWRCTRPSEPRWPRTSRRSSRRHGHARSSAAPGRWAAWTATASTSTAGRSRWAILSERRGPGSPRPSPTR